MQWRWQAEQKRVVALVQPFVHLREKVERNTRGLAPAAGPGDENAFVDCPGAVCGLLFVPPGPLARAKAVGRLPPRHVAWGYALAVTDQHKSGIRCNPHFARDYATNIRIHCNRNNKTD
jgi:hypothetical protein